MKKIIFLVLLCAPITTTLSTPLIKVVPYVFEKHAHVLTLCAIENYQYLFSNSKFDLRVTSREGRKEWGLAQAVHLGKLSNHVGQIVNEDNSITTTQILEIDQIPAGYIMHTAPYPYKDTGTINQLAMLNEYKGLGYGKILASKALDDFYHTPDIRVGRLITLTKELGEKFYAPQLGFILMSEKKSQKYDDEILYTWARLIK